ncbi:alpha-2-macroglobulin [Spirochaetota bacterium]
MHLRNKVIILLSIILIFSCDDKNHENVTSSYNISVTSTSQKKYDSLNNMWEKVKGFEKKGRPRSALKEVQKILKHAKKTKNSPQIVKAEIYRVKYMMKVGRKELPKVIKLLEVETKNAGFPEKPILQSMLAEVYWNYFKVNRYTFYKRTKTSTKGKDISTWSLRRIMDRISQLHLSSLSYSAKLKKLRINIMDDVIIRGWSPRLFRPTLYDFVAHRALGFFMRDESMIRAFYDLGLDSEQYFSKSEDFAQMEIQAKDKLSLKYIAMVIFQDLTKFHLKERQIDPSPLVDVELKRLNFLRSKSTHVDKDNLYINALKLLRDKYKGHSVSGLVSYEIAKWYSSKGLAWKKSQPVNHKWSVKKTIDICGNVVKKFPHTEGAKLCKPLTNSIKSLKVGCESVNLPYKPFRALVKYRNISSLYVRIIKIDGKMRHYLEKTWDHRKNKVNKLKRMEFLYEWSVDLPDDGDMRYHSAEIKIPQLAHGPYVVMTGTDRKFSYNKNAVAYTVTEVSSLSFTHRIDKKKGVAIYVFHRKSGKPLSGVKAVIKAKKYDYSVSRYVTKVEGTYISDSKGHIYHPMEKRKYYYNMFVELEKGIDKFKSPVSSYSYYNRHTARNKTYFFTDRSIYRPGQTIYFKGIIFHVDKGKKPGILPDTASKIEFLDYNNQKISELRVKSNEFGAISGSFVAPRGVLTGRMSIRNAWGSVFVRVEEYKRPKFEAKFEPIKGNYRLGSDIKAKGLAISYSGAPLTNARVKYRVVRRIYFPYTWWSWYYLNFNNKKTVIKRGIAKTDKRGEFKVEFKAMPDKRIPKSEKPLFYYEIHADVTDISGETHSAVAVVRAGYIALAVNVYHLHGNVDNTKPLELKIDTRNYSGEVVSARGSVKVSRIKDPGRILRTRLWSKPDRFTMTKEEYVKNFPNDIYNDEINFKKRKLEKPIFIKGFNTKENKWIRLTDISHWEEGHYLFELETMDAYGGKILYKRYFSVYSPKEGNFKRKTYIYSSLLKRNVEPGSDAKIIFGSAAENVHITLNILRKGKESEKRYIKLNKNKKIISIPIRESDRGNLNYRYVFVKDNRLYAGYGTVYVPWTNKRLKAEFITFRNKLKPGTREEWRIKISGFKGEKVAAEIAASMYDASLDSFYYHSWYFNVHPSFYNYQNWGSNPGFAARYSNLLAINWNKHIRRYHRRFDRLNLFGTYFYSRGRRYRYRKNGGASGMADYSVDDEKSKSEIMRKPRTAKKKDASKPVSANQPTLTGKESPAPKDEKIQVRKKLDETAFFFPHLKTNRKGEVIISFTAPEALTKWKVLGLAHTKDLESVVFRKTLVTQKELMVTPNLPRFLRQGDRVTISSKITNLSKNKLTGKASLKLYDAITMKPIDNKLGNLDKTKRFAVDSKGNTAVSWDLKISHTVQAVICRIVASSGYFTDGEENALPVLSNRILITETMPLPVRGREEKNFIFKKLLNSGSSKTLKHERLTLEFTSNPVWYAVQALPYLMEYPHECSEQVFSRFYANSLAFHIVNASPKIKAVFDKWKSSKALLSNLQKNEELKSVLLQETPWVLNAHSEEQSKKRVALLFDLSRMSREMTNAFLKLREMQGYNGGWPWFKGFPESRYITQHIVAGIAKLTKLGVRSAGINRTKKMTGKAVRFLDNKMKRDYDYLLKYSNDLKKKHISYIIYHYLYTRSFFKDIPISKKHMEAFNYWKGQAVKYWVTGGPYTKGMAAIALSRFDDAKTAGEIIVSLKEHAIYHGELGMYWKENVGGYYWYRAPIETQSLLIEAFNEVSRDRKSVDDMRTWLLKMKQVQHWKTTKATADACYALLLGGTSWFKDTKVAEIYMNSKRIDPLKMGASVEAGTGYFKLNWKKNDIRSEMARVTVNNRNEGPAWGALYWQYFEDMDKVTYHKTPLVLKKEIFRVRYTDKGDVLEPITGKTLLKPGNRLKVRIILKVDRDMDYVHMKDLRASGVEPENVLSSHKYQDGLWYYESTKDTATHFFFEKLPRGTFVFEYPLMVNLRGNFSAGIATIQCMYAPEFTSHSEGTRITIE